MKQVTKHFFSVLVAVLSLATIGSIVTLEFNEEGCKVTAKVEGNLPMPEIVFKSLLSAYSSKVHLYCKQEGIDPSKISLSAERTAEGIVLKSFFTDDATVKPYADELLSMSALQDSAMEFAYDLMNEEELEAQEG